MSMLVCRMNSLRRHSTPLVSRYLSTSEKKKPTVFLPQSPNFSNHIKSTERALSDQNAAINGGFGGLYEWQSAQNERPVFELLDGPPYANGEAHTGHAINKVLKDFVIKSRIGLGYRVIFRPGWDCHGLPIELKIAKSSTQNHSKTPLEIRESARKVADESIGKQMNAFKRWGVTADWKNPYITKDRKYVARQLKGFGEMVEKGMVYRQFKPVYWSPSSNTALAESELEYNEKHQSMSAYFRFKLINVSENDVNWSETRSSSKPIQFFALTWTTTPWTLPLNNAICVSKKIEYSAVQFKDEINNPTVNVYICAKKLIPEFKKTSGREFKILGDISADKLIGKRYTNCWYNELAMPIYEGDHVMDTVGTGLVHTSYAHGFQDYEVANSNEEKVESFVDSNGCYTRHMGHDLSGKSVLGEGQKEALRLLSHDVIYLSKYIHSYPYDWRTKKPVIIRSSQQWFIDVGQVGNQASELIDSIQVSAGDSDLRASLKSLVTTRKAWCISRQRVWGTPIPALIDKDGQSFTSKQLINYVADKIEENGPDYWWKVDVEEIIKNLGIDNKNDYEKNMDIMDVWLDSGLAWFAARNDSQKEPVDVVLEGVDQFRGWFQSLLLTSIACTGQLPYKHVIVHGFCIDEKNQKMSKSIGNVVDPITLTDGTLKQKAIGADGLRFWVALGGSENAGESKIGQKTIDDVDKKVIALRNGFRFMIGGCHGFDGISKPESSLRILDQDILYNLNLFTERSVKNYENFKFRTVANDLIQFMARNFSANYVKYVRDRLYCDKLGSDSHLSAQFTLHTIAHNLAHLISPILPHLSAEVLHELPGNRHEKRILRGKFEDVCRFDHGLDYNPNIIRVIQNIRNQLEVEAGPKIDTSKRGVLIGTANPEEFKILDEILKRNELCELLNVSEVMLSANDKELKIMESQWKYCERCRKHTRDPLDSLCIRCAHAVNQLG